MNKCIQRRRHTLHTYVRKVAPTAQSASITRKKNEEDSKKNSIKEKDVRKKSRKNIKEQLAIKQERKKAGVFVVRQAVALA